MTQQRTPNGLQALALEQAQDAFNFERQCTRLRAVNADLLAALEMYVGSYPDPWCSHPIGAPNSLARLAQEDQTAAYKMARAAIAKARQS